MHYSVLQFEKNIIKIIMCTENIEEYRCTLHTWNYHRAMSKKRIGYLM